MYAAYLVNMIDTVFRFLESSILVSLFGSIGKDKEGKLTDVKFYYLF